MQLADANGIVVRQNNGTLAYVAFSNPTLAVQLDAAGDHAALAGGRIAVTADELQNGADYNGDGDSNDFLLRVFDLTGAVLEEGRLCSQHSVPTSETGAFWAYLRDEAAEARDLNGDTDQTDLVLGLWVP